MKNYGVGLLGLFACFWLTACNSLGLVTLGTPTFDEHYMSKSVAKEAESSGTGKVNIKLVSEEADTNSVSTWLKEKKPNLSTNCYHDGYIMRPLKQYKVVDWATKYRTYDVKKKTYHLAHVIEQDHVVLFFYGSSPNEFYVITDPHILVIRDKRNENVKHEINLIEFSKAPNYMHKDREFVFQQTTWARVEGDVLYVNNTHWTYTKSSHGHNGYVTAINLKNNQVLWRSQPLVSNAVNFEVTGSKIITSYGFTREEAWVYALDKETGKVVGKHKISEERNGKKHPEFIVVNGNRISVKTFDGTEYELTF